MSILNQEAPPPEVKAQNHLRFEPIPKSDTYVGTLVGTNYLPEVQFPRTDDDGVKTIEIAPGIEFFFGVEIDGKAYFTRSWPKKYSIHKKASYYQWFEAITGRAPEVKDRPVTAVGGHALIEIAVTDKVGSKGTAYKAVNIKSVKPVPGILSPNKIPLDKLKPAFEAALAKSSEKKDGDVPF